MAYDASSRRLVLFGGHDGTSYLGDTWTFDGASRTWTQLHPKPAPSPRYVANMASDGTGVVLFSGTDGWAVNTEEGPTDPNGPGHLRDTWTWEKGAWTNRTPAPPPPPPAPAITEFANTAPIVVPLPVPPPGCPGVGCPPDTANPYPSNIGVSGLAGKVDKVTVTLHGLSWTQHGPADADIMLVAPGGRAVMVMSDACGEADHPIRRSSAITLTFDDAAAAGLSRTGPCASGTFRPTDVEVPESTPFHAPDAFPAPAPPGTNSASFGDLRGIDPNGTWSLYVVDDHPNEPDPNGRAGRIGGGWSLDIVTSTSTPATTAAPTTTVAPATTTTLPPGAPPPDLPPVDEVPVTEPPPEEPALRPGDLVFEPVTEETGFFGDDPPIPAAVGAAVVLAVALGAISLRRRARSRRPLGRR
jgi:hypothetical protein